MTEVYPKKVGVVKPQRRLQNSDPYLASARILRDNIVSLRKEIRELISLLKQASETAGLPVKGLDAVATDLDNDQ